MLQLVVLLKQNTLAALREHTTAALENNVEVNENEVLVMLDADVVAGLIEQATRNDRRLDDVILRLAVSAPEEPRAPCVSPTSLSRSRLQWSRGGPAADARLDDQDPATTAFELQRSQG